MISAVGAGEDLVVEADAGLGRAVCCSGDGAGLATLGAMEGTSFLSGADIAGRRVAHPAASKTVIATTMRILLCMREPISSGK